MRIVYPVLWSRLGRPASRDQTVQTVAALARRGHAVTLLVPRGARDPALTAADLRDYHAVDGDFRVVQRRSRWAGENMLTSLLWLRRVFADPELAGADLLLSRIPVMLGMGQVAPLPFATDHYRLWADELPAIRWSFRLTARHHRCLGVIVHSAYAAESWRRIGIPEERLLVAHNGVAGTARPRLDRAQARRALGLPADARIALYAGRINAAKGLDQMLALADRRPDVLFLLVGSEGDGPIERQAAGRANVRIAPWAEPAAVPDWLAAADVLVLPPSSAPLERFRQSVLPMKLFAYLAAGRPILAPVSPDTAELLRHEENALLVPPDDPESAAAALDRLLGDAGLGARLAANAKRLSGSLSWDARAARIAGFLEARLAAQRSEYSSTVRPASATKAGAAQAPTVAGK